MTEPPKPQILIPYTRKPLPAETVKQIEAQGLDLKKIEEQRQRVVDELEAKRRAFTTTCLTLVPSLDEMRFLKDGKYSGSFLHPKEGPQATSIGDELELLEVKFYRVQGQNWNPPAVARMTFPMQHNVVPLIGGIYVKGKKLSDEELEQHGLQVVTDDQNKPAKYMIFATSGRSAILPGHFEIPVMKTEKGFRLIQTDEELRQLGTQHFGQEVMQQLGQATREVLKRAYD